MWRLGVGFVSRVGMWGKMGRARLLVRSREFRWLETDIVSSDKKDVHPEGQELEVECYFWSRVIS
jgi:hypothetical protein